MRLVNGCLKIDRETPCKQHPYAAHFSRQFFQQLIEPRPIFLAHLDESSGHTLAGLDIFDDRSGANFAARDVKNNLQ